MAHKTDWFYGKKWGAFIHLLNGVQNSPGRAANMGAGHFDWSDYIDTLDADFIADLLGFLDGGDAIFRQHGVNLIDATLVAFE